MPGNFLSPNSAPARETPLYLTPVMAPDELDDELLELEELEEELLELDELELDAGLETKLTSKVQESVTGPSSKIFPCKYPGHPVAVPTL